MRKFLLKIISVLLLWVNVFSLLFYCTNRKEIAMDINRYLWMTPFKKAGVLSLNYLLLFSKNFRSIFFYRICKYHLWVKLFGFLIPKRLPGIELGGKIGGGVLLFHNMGCVVAPYSAGKNLTVAQGVTVGKGNKNEEGRDNPILGDNVWICTNAVVFGGITIGNNVKIGAGTILNRSVPDNCVVAGNPARIIKRDGVACNEPL